MVIYTEGGTTFRVCWAFKPYVLTQGGDNPHSKLVGIRRAGDMLQIAHFQSPFGVRWVSPDQYLCSAEAESWVLRGFQPTGLRQ